MKKPALAVCVGFLGLGLAACSSSSNPPPRSGQIFLTWNVVDNATGDPLFCLPGEKVVVTAGTISDVFPCSDGVGTTGAIPEGNYAVGFDLEDSAGTVESTTTIPVSVIGGVISDAGHIIFAVNTTPLPTNGDAVFSWEIRVGSAGGPNGTCASGELVDLDFGSVGTVELDCSAAQPVTVTNLPAGSYNIQATLSLNGTVESNTVGGIAVDVPAGGTAAEQHIIFVVNQ